MTDALIVGTAGHIDHGKTSLVRALTGRDLDRLPEEQDRGITIALGFAPLQLADGRRLAFVDVPGHERLVRTMIAGATGIDAVMLCVSAVDGVMPQTREHLAILELLGLQAGVVVLTMADRVDAELLELAQEDAREAVAGTFLSGAPILSTSAQTGQGIEALKEALGALPARHRASEGPFRLPVDRSFVRPGFGTVVTGTAWSGQVRDGEAVVLLPGERGARVRGIEVHGAAVKSAGAGSRVALNLAGIDRVEVGRGVMVTTGEVPSPQILDVKYHHLKEAPPFSDRAPVRVLLGTAECLGRLHLAIEAEEVQPGQTVPAQLRLAEPLPCLPGDRFILRRTSPMQTLGGGEVVDPWAPKMRRRDRVAHGEQIRRLHQGKAKVWLERAGEQGLSPRDWAIRCPDPERRQVGERLGDRVYSPAVIGRLAGRLLEALTTFHAEHPLSLGAHRRELHRGRLAHLTERVFDALVDRMAGTGQVHVDGAMLRVAGFAVALDPRQQGLHDAIASTLAEAGLQGVGIKALHEAHPEPETGALLRLMERQGLAVQLPGLGWIGTEALRELARRVGRWFEENEALSPGDLKGLTGTTRKAAIPLLEWLDGQRLTVRQGDQRVAGPALERG